MAQVERATSVGGKTFLTNVSTLLQYSSDLTILGYMLLNNSGISIYNMPIEFNVIIPNNYVIDSAYITIKLYKTKNYFTYEDTPGITDVYGKATNIRLYKTTDRTEYTNSDSYGTFVETPATLTEIPSAFGNPSYTNATTGSDTVVSLDLTNYLTVGLNELVIKNPDTLTYTDANILVAANKTQMAFATLDIIGHTK